MILRLLTLVLLTFAASTSAQTIAEISGGASSNLGSGGGLVLYGAGGETHFSAGAVNGRFVYNTSERFEFRKNWEVYLGDYQQPLTTGQFSLVNPVRGIALVRRQRHGELRLFGGATGQIFSSPYFWGFGSKHGGAGISWRHIAGHGFTFGSIEALAGPQKTALQEVDWRPDCAPWTPQPPIRGAGAFRNCWWKAFEFRAQAGWLQNNRQVGGTANFSTKHLGATANRSTYIFAPQPGQSTSPVSFLPFQRINVNSGSVFGGLSIFNASASIFQSSNSSGTNLSLSARVGPLQVQASDFNSRSLFQGVLRKQTGQFLTFSERLNLHLSLSQFVSRSQGAWNYSAGGAYSSNRFSLQVSENLLYYPLLSHPFQRTLSVTLTFRIKSASVNVGTIALPNGRVQWTTGGQDYAAVPGLKMPAIPGATEADIRSLPSRGHGGKYVITGFVVDDKGAPVEGACVKVNGSDPVFTDSAGHFSAQEKHKDVPIHVDTENFMQGEWVVVEAPAMAHAGEPVHIVVKRKNP